MIQGWIQWPMTWRCVVVALVGVLIGTQINRAIYRWAWYARWIGPWSPPHPHASPQKWQDKIPIVGWWFLRRDAPLHGAGFWIRPMFIEFGFGAALVFLYQWLSDGGILPIHLPPQGLTTHAQFVTLTSLLVWITIGTFIDIDEQTIPDLVTIPGALLGLSLSILLPQGLLPTWDRGMIEPLQIASPGKFSDVFRHTTAVGVGVLLYLAWWFVIWPKTICWRHGYLQGFHYLVASMRRHPAALLYLALVVTGATVIAIVGRSGGLAWQKLLSSLAGMVWGGSMVWGVRIVGTQALGREAMGFGDVTLMAMIGTYLGWQGSTLVFFIAPFTGVALALAVWMLTGRPAIPYGPFLSAGTVVVVLSWPFFWDRYAPVFLLGPWIPAVGLVCLLLMGGMLLAWRRISG